MHTHPQTYIDVTLDHAQTGTVFLKAPVEIMKILIVKSAWDVLLKQGGPLGWRVRS